MGQSTEEMSEAAENAALARPMAGVEMGEQGPEGSRAVLHPSGAGHPCFLSGDVRGSAGLSQLRSHHRHFAFFL